MAAKKKHDWSQFRLKIEIKASPTKVFKAWTDPKIISRWFTVKTEFEPVKGGRIYFEWLGGDKFETTVSAIRKNERILFPFGSKGEMVEVKLAKNGRKTIVTLRQYDMRTTPEARWSIHKGCEVGWAFFLTNLKSWLEHGIDLRSHDKMKSYKQGFVNS
ncbi:MAG: SRPBCC domain-containing protein [candidate division Zixibacteria bacterium]|nr:SRPBCC domain-containing protein [candidate division Zixibacteria bacterium]